MFCPQCGLNSPESAKFCSSCGSSLSANAAESTEDLARKVHDHVSDTIRKTTAVTSCAVRGVRRQLRLQPARPERPDGPCTAGDDCRAGQC